MLMNGLGQSQIRALKTGNHEGHVQLCDVRTRTNFVSTFNVHCSRSLLVQMPFSTDPLLVVNYSAAGHFLLHVRRLRRQQRDRIHGMRI